MTQGKIVLQIPASVTNTRVKPAATRSGLVRRYASRGCVSSLKKRNLRKVRKLHPIAVHSPQRKRALVRLRPDCRAGVDPLQAVASDCYRAAPRTADETSGSGQ